MLPAADLNVRTNEETVTYPDLVEETNTNVILDGKQQQNICCATYYLS